MTTFDSDIQKIATSNEAVFSKLSNLENLQQLAGKFPSERVKLIQVSPEICIFEVEMMGEIGIRLSGKTPYNTVNFVSERSPIQFDLTVNIENTENNSSTIQLQLKADLPLMVKMVVNEPIQKFINMLATSLATIQY